MPSRRRCIPGIYSLPTCRCLRQGNERACLLLGQSHTGPAPRAGRFRIGVGLVAVLIAAGSARPLHAQSLSAQEILARTSARYRSLTSYRFDATVTVVSALADNNLSHTTKGYTQARILVAAAEPNRLRVEHRGGDVDVIYVNDGRTAWTYLPARHAYSRQVGATLMHPGGPADFLSHNPILAPLNVLVARPRYFGDRGGGATLERQETLRVGQVRVPCWVIALRDGAGRKQEELWIDQSRFLVLRDSAEVQESGGTRVDDAGLAVLHQAADTQVADGQTTLHETITVDWTRADLGAPADPALFESPVPANARLVQASGLEGLAHAALNGSIAPDFRLRDTSGASVSLSALRGKVVVLEFWASWCRPCHDDVASVDRVARTIKDPNVVFLGVDAEDAEDAKAFLNHAGLSFPTLLDPQGGTYLQYGFYEVPSLAVIDASGRVMETLMGGASEESVRAAISEAQLGH